MIKIRKRPVAYDLRVGLCFHLILSNDSESAQT